MKVLKPAVSVTLLVGVILLVGFYYGTAEISDDIRALSVCALGAVSLRYSRMPSPQSFVSRLSQAKSSTR